MKLLFLINLIVSIFVSFTTSTYVTNIQQKLKCIVNILLLAFAFTITKNN